MEVTGCCSVDETVLSMSFHIIVVYTCSSLGTGAKERMVRVTPGYIIYPRQRWYELWIIPTLP